MADLLRRAFLDGVADAEAKLARDRVLAQAGLPPGFEFAYGARVVNAPIEARALGLTTTSGDDIDEILSLSHRPGRLHFVGGVTFDMDVDRRDWSRRHIPAVPRHVRERYARGQF